MGGGGRRGGEGGGGGGGGWVTCDWQCENVGSEDNLSCKLFVYGHFK